MAQTIYIDNKSTLNMLLDNFGENKKSIEDIFKVVILVKNNTITISGSNELEVKKLISSLDYKITKKELKVEDISVNFLNSIAKIGYNPYVNSKAKSKDVGISIKKNVIAKNTKQQNYLDIIDNNTIVFATGIAGTGKTYLAVAKAIEYFLKGKVDKLIFSRPAVEAGESIGYLPGTMQDKVNPYLRPIHDALEDLLPKDFLQKKMQENAIEITPLAFMRGRTFNNSFVILDEAQNTTVSQLKMFLTRIGNNTKMVIAGDTTQVDLPKNIQSGLLPTIKALDNTEDIGNINFIEQDVVRSKILSNIISKLDNIK